MLPDTRYARSGDLRIAYQVVGQGPIDLVFVLGFISNIDLIWDDPVFAEITQPPRGFLAPDPFRQTWYRPLRPDRGVALA